VMTVATARPVVRPVGFGQLLCLAAILLAAALRLPAQSITFLDDELGMTIISSEGGRFVFFGVIAGAMLAVLQLVALRRPGSGIGRVAALMVTGAALCIGLVIAWLGVRIGFNPLVPDDMRPSPGVGAIVVILAGAGYAFLSTVRLWRLGVGHRRNQS
jgi:hypothetical protein